MAEFIARPPEYPESDRAQELCNSNQGVVLLDETFVRGDEWIRSETRLFGPNEAERETVLYIRNGDINGGYRTAQATIWINGFEVVSGILFNANFESICIFVDFLPYQDNIVDIEIGGVPGSQITVKLLRILPDQDGDGYIAIAYGGDDCDDNNPLIHPGAPEFCNGVDDNCDGTADEGFPVGSICSVGVGECYAVGTYVCSPDGLSIVCAASPGLPSPEVCDGLDNDCDGLVDEGGVCDSDGDGIPDSEDNCPLEDSTGFDADADGCIDNLQDLPQIIEALPDGLLSDQTKNSLISKVNNALKSVDKDADNAAINQVQAFINEINAQRGKKISEEAADMLIQYANNIIAQIEE
ncbi:putative metal-binding motif-containing protein [bacterium]|nr:putative metal-binding motif-containing protein [bacterium]